MEKFEIDHIGIAIENLEKASEVYKLMGFSDMAIEEVASESVRVGFLKLENQANIELLESTSEDGPISKFIKKRGEGIHHICLRVKDIESTLNELKEKGVRLINESPKQGAHNCLVAFIHPKSTGGVLIELSQPQGGA